MSTMPSADVSGALLQALTDERLRRKAAELSY
jgi:hypothetical protein